MDVGVLIDQYKVIEHIGRGGMADVWSARDQKLNRMVAIKTIAQTLSGDTDPVDMFKQEAQIIAQMEHPHILPIYDFGEFEGQLYIVMRYVAGGSLEDLLQRGPVPLNEALRLGQAIAQALDHAHLNSVIHLDLKPPNVLLDSHQSPYLADFGLATALDPEGKAINPGSGTLLYMAPEQLTAETIDHRADIYSFSIVMFHMLSGQLPFEAASPLALKQIQFHEDLPDVESINSTLPSYFSNILRRGTSVEPNERPATLMELLEELREVVAETTGFATGFESGQDDDYDEEINFDFESGDMELLEAVDIYSRARHNWAGGNGRFLLGVTHFMLMNSYYMNAEMHGLELDEAGMQMILRGALEYDHELDFWWDAMNDVNRRWVCLHALRSGNAPARVRSLYRLETIPDAEIPQIPRLVAQALQVETNEEARMASLQVLGTRAKLMKRDQRFDIKTEYRGRMLTTMTRIGIQVNPPHEWIDVIYTPDIDTLIAEIALDRGMPKVAEFAARIVGRIRSNAAVKHIVEQQKEGRKGALRALALVRDEAPTLPPVVSVDGRMYAWSANTIRRMTDQPMKIVFRYLFALIGGWMAMGYNIFATYRSEAIFTPQRLGNAMSIGLVFGVFVAFTVLASDEFSARLRKFWPWWVRLAVALITGFWMATITWGTYTYFFLQYSPNWDVMRFAGFGLVLGFILTSLFNLRSWVAVFVTAVVTYIPIAAMHHIYWGLDPKIPFGLENSRYLKFVGTIIDYVLSGIIDISSNLEAVPVLYYDQPAQVYSIAVVFSILVAIGGHFPSVATDVGNTILKPLHAAYMRKFEGMSQQVFSNLLIDALAGLALGLVASFFIGGSILPVALFFVFAALFSGAIATLMWRNVELQGERARNALLPADEIDAISPVPGAVMKPLVDAADMKTEMDVAYGDYGLDEDYDETELDANMGMPAEMQDHPAGDYAATEMDVNLGLSDVAEEDMQQDYMATELDVGTILPGSEDDETQPYYPTTEMDVNMGIADTGEEEQKPDYAATELDIGMGNSKDEKDTPETPPSAQSRRVDIGTGIHIDDVDSDKTELDVRSKLNDEDEEEDK
jgi:hypothetical protein